MSKSALIKLLIDGMMWFHMPVKRFLCKKIKTLILQTGMWVIPLYYNIQAQEHLYAALRISFTNFLTIS